MAGRAGLALTAAARVGGFVLLIAYAIGAAVLVAMSAAVGFSALDPWGAAAQALPGLLLVGAGTAGAFDHRVRSASRAALVAALAWLAPVWAGWAGHPLVRSLGLLAEPCLGAALVHLAVASWLTPRRLGQAITIGGYAVAAVISVGRALFRDPFLAADCWSNCTDNVFLLYSTPNLVIALGAVESATGLLTALAASAVALAVSPASSRRDPVWSPLRVAILGAGLAAAAWALVRLRGLPEDPASTPLHPVHLLLGAALTAVGLGLGWATWERHRRGSAVRRLADELGVAPTPGSLGSALATILDDPDLAVGYWRPRTRCFVDASGQPFEPQPGPHGSTTTITRDGAPLAVIIHGRTRDSAEWERAIGAAARLAIDNERLSAEVRAELEELRASRTRIVESADTARIQMERNLHDGAQQRLLALLHVLMQANAAAQECPESVAAVRTAESASQIRIAIAELRELAHGIFPAILDEAGLAPALRTLADRAPLVVELRDLPADRLPNAVERTTYAVVSETVEQAHRAGIARLGVGFYRDDHQLVLTITGAAGVSHLHQADRIGALGGLMRIDGDKLEAEIPCGSL